MAMRALLVFCALVAGSLMGCASVPMATPEADGTAKQFQAKPGYANIYLYRNETFGAAIAMTVSLDGKIEGRTGPQTYFLWEVAPGKHEIASHTENTARIVIDAQAGKNHYVWQEVKMGFWQPASQLHEVSEIEGKKGVLECKRATAEAQ
jgi:hypothetical protein